MGVIAVVGLGSIGSIFTAHLIAGGRHKVYSCVRSKVDRIRVEGDYGVIEAKPLCFTDPESVDPVDVVLLATKSQDTPGAAPWLKRLGRPGAAIAVLQNGVDHEFR